MSTEITYIDLEDLLEECLEEAGVALEDQYRLRLLVIAMRRKPGRAELIRELLRPTMVKTSEQ